MNRSTSFWLCVAAWLAVLLWAVAITVLSSMTPRQLHQIAPFEFSDKAAHFTAFAIGAALLALALRWSAGWRGRWIAVVALVAISLFGVVDEFHQTFTPFRSGLDVFDWLADTLGAAAGALTTLLLHARSTRTPRLAPAGN